MGSVRSGKTWAMIPKLLTLCRYKVAGRRIITGASKMAIYNNVLSDLFDVVGSRNYSYNQSSGALRLFDTSWRCIGAGDLGAERYIRGSTVGIGYSDELTLMPKNFYQMLMSRMSPRGARFYASTNADSPYHWVKTDVLDNQKLIEKGDLFTETFALDDNPNLDEEYKEFVGRSYAGLWHDRFIKGLWTLAEGAVYADVLTDDIWYDDDKPAGQGGPPLGLKTRGGHRERVIACDYGTANATVFLDIYDDGNTLWVSREWYYDSRRERRQMSDVQYGEAFMKFIAGGNPSNPYDNPEMPDQRTWPQALVDPSAASFIQELRNRNVWVVGAENEIIEGIRMVTTMLYRKKIRINKKLCPKLAEEMTIYSWDDNKMKIGKEEPVKFADHSVDALRYHVRTKINQYRLAA